MHAEAFDYIRKAVGWLGDTAGFRVIEFGSHDVNGSPRGLFPKVLVYTGVDPWDGPGVDVVKRAQDFSPAMEYDVCISAETLEHDPDPIGQINAAWLALRSGGKFILTAAAPPRLPHRCDGFVGDMAGEYYRNIEVADLQEWFKGWRNVRIVHNRAHGDIYAMAVKP